MPHTFMNHDASGCHLTPMTAPRTIGNLRSVESPDPNQETCSKSHTMRTGHMAGHTHICERPTGHDDMHRCGSCGAGWATRAMRPVSS
jgi:hypothetical protein